MTSDKKLSEFDRLKLDTTLGQKAVVHREDIETLDDDEKRANEMIHAIAQGSNPNPDAFKYHGSLVVHIYTPHVIGGMQFITRNLLGDTPEWLVSEAVSALRKDAMHAYGRKRPVKRSGY